MSLYNMYISEGIWDLIWAFVPAVIVYLLWFVILWVTKKRKLTDVKNLAVKRMIAEFLLIWYFLAILGITGIRAIILDDRFGIDNYSYTYFSVIPFVGASITMVILNIMLFVPYGFLLPMTKKNCNKKFWKWALLIGFATSLCIETLQYFGGRMSEIDDLIANTWGTMLGYFLWESLHYIYLGEQRKKYIIKGISAILVTVTALYGISVIANADIMREEYVDLYSDMGDEEAVDIDKIKVYSPKGFKDIKIQSEFDDEVYWYTLIGLYISNNAGSYNQSSCNYSTEKIVSENNNVFLEAYFIDLQDFNFYNNPNIEIKDVSHILFNLDDGTVYLGSSDESFTTQLTYENKKIPFTYVRNSEMYSNIQEAIENGSIE